MTRRSFFEVLAGLAAVLGFPRSPAAAQPLPRGAGYFAGLDDGTLVVTAVDRVARTIAVASADSPAGRAALRARRQLARRT